MNTPFSLLAAAALCCGVAACQGGGVSKGKDRMAAQLEIRAPFESVNYQVEGRTCTVQEVGLNGRVLSHAGRELTDQEAAAFWTSLDELQVRQWRRDYGVDTSDGSPPTVWKLSTRRGRTTTVSEGVGAFPADDAPREPSGETSRRFHTLYALFQNTAQPPTAQVAQQVPERAAP